jgi:hypothetical protein
MVTALVIFVLLKAGQRTISAGGNAGLNNFFPAVCSENLPVSGIEAMAQACRSWDRMWEQCVRWSYRR